MRQLPKQAKQVKLIMTPPPGDNWGVVVNLVNMVDEVTISYTKGAQKWTTNFRISYDNIHPVPDTTLHLSNWSLIWQWHIWCSCSGNSQTAPQQLCSHLPCKVNISSHCPHIWWSAGSHTRNQGIPITDFIFEYLPRDPRFDNVTRRPRYERGLSGFLAVVKEGMSFL